MISSENRTKNGQDSEITNLFSKLGFNFLSFVGTAMVNEAGP